VEETSVADFCTAVRRIDRGKIWYRKRERERVKDSDKQREENAK
jgi:hypothetical protein